MFLRNTDNKNNSTSALQPTFEKLSDSDIPEVRAKKIIDLIENEGGFKSVLTNGKLDEAKRNYILQKEYMILRGEWERPSSNFDTAFIMSVGIAREMLADNANKTLKINSQ